MHHDSPLNAVKQAAFALTAAALMAITAAAEAGVASQVNSLSQANLARSGRLLIFGTGFGANQGTGQVLIDGIGAIVTTWQDTEIHAYVPEAAPLGPVTVQVVTPGGPSNALTLDVTLRQPDGRVRWKFQMDSSFPGPYVTLAPDGTVYSGDLSRLYALSPDGALLWVAETAGVRRPISLGADGTIYTGGNLVKALNPDGTVRWEFPDPFPGSDLVAGPNVGPDGNIYVAQDTFHGGGLGPFSLDPDGNLRWSDPDNPLIGAWGGSNSEIAFGTDRIFIGNVTQAGTLPILTAFDFDGDQLWSSVTQDLDLHTGTSPQMDPTGRIIVGWGPAGIQAINPDGSVDWIAIHPEGMNLPAMPGIDSNGVMYTAGWLGLNLWAINPDGSTRWALPNSGEGTLTALNVSPDGSIILVGGSDGLVSPVWVRAYDTADGALLWQADLVPEAGIEQFVYARPPMFTPDSQTVYFNTWFSGTVGFSNLFAVDVSLDLDIDGDGVIDINDNCVADFNPDQADGDGDGIGNACDSISDLCTWPIDLCPGTISGSTDGNTNDGISSCSPFPHLNRDVWYAYTPAVDGTVIVDGCGAPASYYLSVHTGCPGLVGNEIACDFDSCSILWPQVTFNGIAGQTYLIRVTGFGAAEIDYTLTLSGPACDPGGPLPADVNNDGVVNVLDLIELLLCFGQPASPPCDSADVNGDGQVNVLDLIELLVAFGTSSP